MSLKTPFPIERSRSRASRRAALAAVAAAALGLSVLASTGPAHAVADSQRVLSYTFDGSTGATVADTSGNGRAGTIMGGASASADGLALDGVDDYVKLPDDVLAGLTSVSVSTTVRLAPSQATPYMIYALGNTDAGGAGSGYLFATGDVYRASIATGNWSTEQTVSAGASLARSAWTTLTYTLDDATDTAVLYRDGVEVGRQTGVTTTPAAIGNGVTRANYLGRSVYNADRYLAGGVRDFTIWNTALTAAQVSALQPSDQSRVDRDAAALTLGDTSAVTSDLSLPTAGANGTTISWSSSDPAVVSTTGAVTRPAAGSPDASVVLTATVAAGTASATRTFTVTVLAQPNDQAIVDAAAAALVVTNVDDVRGNLTLPTTQGGASVAWSSGTPSVIGANGVVQRPQAEATVALTATVTKGSASAQRVFTATVRAAANLAPYAGYAFTYFTGNTVAGENIYFAASDGNNALKWNQVNGGKPVLTSSFGEKGLRDPFIIRSPEGDTFYLIATDLSIGGGTSWDASQRTGSRYIEVWESHDLVTWSNQRHVLVSPETAGNTWAPEAYYDDTIGAYVVFWASKLYATDDPQHTGDTYNRMLYATTRDFVTFSPPQIWQDGASRIDSTVIEASGTYYRFTKDEGAGTTGCSDIIQERSTDLRATLPSWSMVDACIGRDAGTSAVEGPTVFKSNPGDVNGDKYYLFVDEYGGRGYIPLETANIAAPNWTVSQNYSLPSTPRHGTVLPVTASELAALNQLGAVAPVTANADGEILRYDFTDGSGSTLADSSGNGRNGAIQGNAVWQSGGALRFDGVDDSVDLPDNVLAGVSDLTVEADVWVDPAQSGAYFLYGLGNSQGGAGNGYVFTSGNDYRTSITTGNWTGEQTTSSNAALPRGSWQHLVYTLSGTTARLYLNGTQVGVNTGVTIDPSQIGGGATVDNVIGRSLYSADSLFRGQYREFALYNRALSPSEVVKLSGDTGALAGVGLNQDVLAVDPLVSASSRTVTFAVDKGTDLTALTPTFTTADGVTASPASGTTVDLSRPVTYTLSAPGQASVTWTFKAQVMGSPVLPGLYADPNIAVFGDTYYIYATTDGFPGWGGNTFYVWSSKNLVDWTRSADPILTLDGANGNVPWATGNAWAPTIIEKNGKYYFYFSGHNAALNRKTIGVAVADSPAGPFVAQPQAMIRNDEAVTSGQAIDPAAFHDPVSGKDYLIWGNGSPVMGELSDDMLSIKPGTFTRVDGLRDFREGAFLNYRQGLYHLTYSIDDTGSENYRVGYATATSLAGPWTYRGLILEKDPTLGILGTGHSSIVNVPGTDDWYIAYHRFAIPGGDGTHRETTIDRVPVGADGLFQTVTPTLSSVAAQQVPAAPVTVTPSVASASPANAAGWYRTPATLTFADDSADATVQYRLAGATSWTDATASGLVVSTDGVTTVQYRAVRSGAYVAGSDGSIEVKLDATAPRTTATTTPASGTAPAGQSVSASFTALDAASGVASTEYSLDGGSVWAPVPAGGVSFSTQGSHTVSYRSTDVAGNVEATRSVVLTVAAPTTVAKVTITSADAPSTEGWYQQSVIVKLEAPQAGQKIQYRINDGTWRTYSSSITVSSNGVTTIEHRLVSSNVVVEGSTAQVQVKVDKTAPTASAVRSPGSGTGTPLNPLTVTVSGTDATSGLRLLEYRVNSGSWMRASGGIVFAEVGDYVVSYRATDAAGNVSAVKSLTLTIKPDVARVIKASSSTVTAGSPLTVSLSGFARWSEVTITGGGVVWATVMTDQNGAARTTLRVPAGTPAGSTPVVATGTDPSLTATTTVTVKR